MIFIIEIFVNAGILYLMASLMPSVTIRNYITAIWVALVIGLLNATVGFLIWLPLNILTIGLISFFIRLLVTAVMIKIADKFFKDFEIKGFFPAIIIAAVMGITGSLISYLLRY